MPAPPTPSAPSPHDRRPPGPSRASGAANAADFAVDPLGFLTRCAHEYGDTVALTPTNVLLAHPDDVGRVLVDRDRALVKVRPGERRRGGTGFPLAMMNSEGEDWERKRRRLQPAFRSERLDGLRACARDAAARTADSWTEGQTVDVHEEMSRLAMRVGAVHITGRPLGADADALADAVAAVMRLTAGAVRLPAWMPTPVNLSLRRAMRALDSSLRRIVGEHEPDGGATALGRLVEQRPRAPFAEIRDELATLLMSGYETTADALTWLVHCLGTAPEADAGLARSARGAGADGYAAAAAKEAMRLYPPAWVISRVAVRPVEFGGYRLPEGTVIGLSQWVTHRDARWFPEPDRFRPERWLDGAGPARRYAYFPFGAGARGCLGASMALSEIEEIAIELRARVRFEPVDPDGVRPRAALALQPRGVWARVRKERPGGARWSG
ncbi:cytochrome P450 [Nocardiopsis baichengensis]|uniref:cytochrome P450 n=1 Tax=Nocardiopsis baichengensis TaxID=280240 RepID=UPI00034D2869|nr:cytochrome P450 [Nocardiopsis baichengensis]